ncbi:Cas10/Cmr2 second palm domain-containing protein [Oceanospirillum beijerinckii]|uniref:Cas10/Cmr2 second palm domain-containing protein n=1 Tax=Oceanospirillum beijerinckii TaxID=64976 RepID=UPI000414FB56|nr:hypothetical protein [Oceanospirillum beijerinckii]
MFIVQLEFKRIQTFLFASPRLKDMVGANALLGDVIRQELPELVQQIRGADPFTLNKELLKKFGAKFKKSDPLSKTSKEGWHKDAPQESWENGVLSRDGGHFYAVFSSDDMALSFKQQAISLIQTKLPGVLVEYLIKNEETGQLIDSGMIESDNLPILPIFQPCQFSDQGIAEDKVAHPDRKKQYQSTSSRIKREFLSQNGEKQEKNSADIASILTESWLEEFSARPAYDLDKLVDSDYLAVIVADGNNMGRRFKDFISSEKTKRNNREFSWLEEQAIAEAFFFKARSAMRKATDQAIREHYGERLQGRVLPFQLLMLGGDDLLIACQAKDALPLITLIDEKLNHDEQKLLDGDTMTLGAGVVIASHSMPFYRLHHIAEELASSAKVKARSEDKSKSDDEAKKGKTYHESFIDWQIITQSWVDDPILARRKTDIVQYQSGTTPTTLTNETLVLTQKPYVINTPPELSLNQSALSLKQLLHRSELIYDAIKGEPAAQQEAPQEQPEQSGTLEIARSQLRYLQSQLPSGRRHGELVWKKLPSMLRNRINELFSEDKQPFSDKKETLPWYSPENSPGIYQTRLSDLIELIEIQTLQRAVTSKPSATAKTPA